SQGSASADRKLIQPADDETMRAVVVAEAVPGRRVGSIEEPERIHRARPRVGHVQGVPMREPLLCPQLQRVVERVAGRLRFHNAAELRIWPQQVGSRNQLRVDAVDAVERVRKLLAEEINRLLVAFW